MGEGLRHINMKI